MAGIWQEYNLFQLVFLKHTIVEKIVIIDILRISKMWRSFKKKQSTDFGIFKITQDDVVLRVLKDMAFSLGTKVYRIVSKMLHGTESRHSYFIYKAATAVGEV